MKLCDVTEIQTNLTSLISCEINFLIMITVYNTYHLNDVAWKFEGLLDSNYTNAKTIHEINFRNVLYLESKSKQVM